MDLVVSVAELEKVAQCARRMTGYAKSDDNLLITRWVTEDGVPVRLFLSPSSLCRDIVTLDSS